MSHYNAGVKRFVEGFGKLIDVSSGHLRACFEVHKFNTKISN